MIRFSSQSTQMPPLGRRVANVFAAVALVAIAASPLANAFAATTMNVTTTDVVEVVDGQCSLLEAIRAARTNTTVNECSVAGGPPYTINLQANASYSVALVDAATSSYGLSALMLNSGDVTINGNGATIRQVNQLSRVLEVLGGNVTLRNLTITGGSTTSDFTGYFGWGAGIIVANVGTVLNLEDVTISGNVAQTDGSAIFAFSGALVNIHRSTIANNSFAGTPASQIRLAFSSTLNIANSTISGNEKALSLTEGSIGVASNVTIETLLDASISVESNSRFGAQNSIITSSCIGGVSITVASGFASCSPTLIPRPTFDGLAANGGITRTLRPRLPNEIIDAAPGCIYASTGSNPLFSAGEAITTDQRGFPRDSQCDLGAFESLKIAPATLPAATVGTAYSATLSQTGGGAPVTFAVTAGALPTGVALSTAGVFSGTPSTVGSFTFTVTATDAVGFQASNAYTVGVDLGNQTLTFAAQATTSRLFVAGGTFAIDPLATASSGLAPTYSSGSTSICTVSGTTVTMVTAGTCVIRADQAGNSSYNAATQVTQNVTINPGVQTLTFNAQTTASQTFIAGGTFAINPVATTNAGAPAVEHASLTPAVCTLSGTTVTIVAAGTCTLRASHVGNSNYQPAVSGTQNVTINPAAQVIVFTAPATKALDDAPFNVSATGGASGNPVMFASLTPTICSATGVNGSLVTILRAGTCTLRASQLGNGNYLAAVAVERSILIGGGQTEITIATSSNPSSYRTPVTLTARVGGAVPGGAVPGGVVRFLNGTATLCEAAVSNGVATCTVSDLLEGAHSLRAYYLGDANNQPSFSTEFVQIVPKVGIHQGAWWGGPQESGWGLSIMEQGNTLVAAWYFFDSAGKPTWLILPGCAWNANKTACTGPLQRAAGSWFGNYRADDVRLTQVGSATFTFSDAGNGRFDYSVDGTGGSKVISRMDLGGNPSAPFDFTSVWWGGQSQNGWGLSLFAAGPTLAGVWYTYDTQGQPTWMLFNGGSWQNPSRYRSGLFRATGSPMIGATYDASRLSVQPVGELYFEFADFNTAEMTYLVDGLLQFKNITKQKF